MTDYQSDKKQQNQNHEGTKRNKKTIIEDDGDSTDERETSGKGKKKYSVIPQSVREKFIKRVLSKEVTIKEAAKEFGLKFSTSKAILQTYKKEGRIGKKKNRERKTKVVNAVFIANINPLAPYTSTIAPLISINELKGSKGAASIEANKNKLVEQALLANPDHKIISQTQVQIPSDSNKTTQQFIKDMGADFLKEFLEKNFGPNKMVSNLNANINGLNIVNNLSNASNLSHNSNLSNSTNMGTVISLGNSHLMNGITAQPTLPNQNLNTNNSNNNNLGSIPINIPAMSNTFVIPQPNGNIFNDVNQQSSIPQIPQLNLPTASENNNVIQKRGFQISDKDMVPELELRNEQQISDVSVKRFRSGEDVLWDFDYDKSKRDLEDFIFKTHNAIKNNSYVERMVSFDFSKYKDEFCE